MDYVVFETKSRQVYSGDSRDKDELSSLGRDAMAFNFLQAEVVAENLNRQHGYRYSFIVIDKNSVPV